MRILEIKVMRGPNVWSTYRQQVVVMRLDLGPFEELPSNQIPGFAQRLEALLPSLVEHRCSVGRRGGFFQRVQEGTWMGHIVEHVALELQTLAGMDVGYGRTRSDKQPGVYFVVFAYQLESAGRYAAEAAVRLVQAVADGRAYDVGADLDTLRALRARDGFGPSTQSIVDEARRRRIPVMRLDEGSTVMLGYGARQKWIQAAVASTTSNIAVELASDKAATKKLLEAAHVPVPCGVVIRGADELDAAIADVRFPLVIKPLDGNHGRGVTTDITTREAAVAAFELASRISSEVIVERYVTGHDYRFLVVNYKLVAVAKRKPACVFGDGQSTIQQLIDEANRDPRRGDGHENVLTFIKVCDITRQILRSRGLTLESVLPAGEPLCLKDTANLSTGGTARDVTDKVHPYNVFLAERVARLMGLDICGLDVMTHDVSVPLTEETGAIIEVNAGPGLRMHLAPSKGLPRNVAAPILDMLFPEGPDAARIPLVAVTGTNGKTTTVRLIAHLAGEHGRAVGYTATEGIYLRDHKIYEGDCSGPASAHTVLRDPTVDFAVLECARGGILRAGLGFDRCDVSVVTNVSSDHLGLEGIDTLDELAQVKAVVPRSTKREGYAVLNADDDLVYAMRKELDCRIALFSLDAENRRVRAHCADGGLACVVEKGWFVLCRGAWKTRLARVVEVPLTHRGRAACMIANVLPAILAAVASGISEETIGRGLRSFVPSPAKTPGRMNLFAFERFEFMVDYAHNEGALEELKKYVAQVQATRKIGIIAAPGDRRAEDIRTIGRLSAEMFDEIIIRHDPDGRGRTNEEITTLLRAGIDSVNPHLPVTIVSDEIAATQYAMDHAPDGAFILITAEKVEKLLRYVAEAHDRERKGHHRGSSANGVPHEAGVYRQRQELGREVRGDRRER